MLAVLLLLGACVNVNPTPTPTASPAIPPTTPPTASQTAASTASVQPTSTADSSATPSGGTETPRPTIDPALAAQIEAVTAGVPAVRELDAVTDVPYEFISRDQFRDELLALVEEDVPVEVRAAEERLLKRLGLLAASAEMDALIRELYGSQVLAYYRPDNGRFYIIERGQPFGATDKIVVAHEYTHALQDQHFDLEANQITDPFEGDAALGQLAVIEGDATLTSQLWAIDNLTPEELFELLGEALSGLDQDVLEGIPLVLRRQLEFPYGEGMLFVNGLYEDGGFDAVNAAIEAPPASTEQILHPEKYSAHEEPVEVPMPDLELTLGAGWSRSYEQTFGELGIQILATGGEEPALNLPGLPVDWPHQEVAAGWSGDRLNMYENTDGRWALLWRTVWDTPADAAEFEARLGELVSTFTGASQVSTSPPSQGFPAEVDLHLADTQQTLDTFMGSFGTLLGASPSR